MHNIKFDGGKFCKEKDLEVCAVKLHLLSCEICVITIYGSPSGNFQYLMGNLEQILCMIYSNNTEIMICGDININYLIDSTHKQLLDLLLASYGLCSTVQFSTRIQSNSAIDNIFINTFKFNDFSLFRIIIGLSDHIAQRIIICNILKQNCNSHFCFKQRTDKSSITDFNTKLSYESWGNIFAENDVNTIFNNFLNTYLRIFYSSFPLKKVRHKSCNKAWLTPGINFQVRHPRCVLCKLGERVGLSSCVLTDPPSLPLGIKISCANKRKVFISKKQERPDDNLLQEIL